MLAVALAFAVQAAAEPAGSAPPPPALASAEACSPRRPASDREIVICAPKPDGYRIDPDVLQAKRHSKNRTRPRPPDKMKDMSCTVVGPAGCIAAPGIDMLAAAATVARMADRLSKGQEIGSMFVTDPQPDEYKLYKEAKARREAEEAEQAAKAKAKAAREAASSSPQSSEVEDAKDGPSPE